MARKNTDGSPIGAYSCPSSQRGCAVVNELSAVQFYCPRATKLSLPVHDLPSQSFRSNGGCCPTALQPFWSLPCAHSAVRGGFCPMFLLCCALANPRLYNTQPHDVTELKLCNSAKLWENSFAKYRTLRKHSKFGLNTVYYRSSKMSISISRTCHFAKISPQTRMNTGLADSFAKYDTLRNFLSIGRKKHGTLPAYRVFVYSPAAYPPPTSSPRSQVYTQHTTSPSCSVYLEQP